MFLAAARQRDQVMAARRDAHDPAASMVHATSELSRAA